jgi:hypothetical protein
MFPAGRAKDPVTGVRFADAAAFARWLTERGGGEYLYRLPQVTELSAALDGARLQEGPQAWCEEEHRALLEGTCPRDEEDLLEALSRRYGDGSLAWWRALRADGRSPEDLRAKEDNNDLARDVQLMLARGNASSSDPLSDAAASIDLAREIQLATSYVLSMTRGWSDLSCMFATALALDGACRLVRANQIEMFDEIMALKLRNELLVAATWVPISDTDRQGSLREGERALVVGGVHLITRADTKNDRILSGIAGARRYAADILRGVSPPAVEGMSSAEWARARARSISFARAAYVDMAGDAAREIGGELSRAVDQGDFADALRIMTHTEVPRRREDAQAMDRLGRAFAGLSRVSADDVLDAWINLVEVLRQELSAPERRALPSSTLLATLLKHLKVIEARRSGRLRAYEGIRIVRERARRE